MARRLALPLLAIAALTLSACSSTAGDDAAAGEVSLITEGALTVCSNPPYPPFEMKDGDQVVGLDIDVVSEAAADLGVELVIVETGFDGIQSGAALDAAQCDVVASGITITEEREGKLDFSDPYFDANQGLLVPAGSGIDSLEALEGVTVGVQQATTGETFTTDNGLETVQYEDTGLQVQALKNGDVGAIINDLATMQEYVDDEFVIGAEFETGEQYGLGVKTGNAALLDAINATIERIKSDGTYDDIYATYFDATS